MPIREFDYSKAEFTSDIDNPRKLHKHHQRERARGSKGIPKTSSRTPKDQLPRGIPDTIYPDGAYFRRISLSNYVEVLTGIKLYDENVQKGLHNKKYRKQKWFLEFPHSGLKIRIKTYREGTEILWNLREAIKDVLERYYVTSYDPMGVFRTYIPIIAHLSSNRNPRVRLQRGPSTSPCFLACI